MGDKLIYKIESSDIFINLLRLTSLIFLGFCLYNFNKNPQAFSIFAILSILVILFSRTKKILLTEGQLVIVYEYLIRRMNCKTIIMVEDIKSVTYEKEFKPLWRFLLPMGHNLLKESELKLYLENDEYYILKRIGTKKSFLKLKNKITDALNQRQTRR